MNPLDWTLVKQAIQIFGAPVTPPDHSRVSKHLGGHVAPGTSMRSIAPVQRTLPKSKARRGGSYNRALFHGRRASRKP